MEFNKFETLKYQLNSTYPLRNYVLLLFSLLLFGFALFFEREINLDAGDFKTLTAKAQKALAGEELKAQALLDSVAKNAPSPGLNTWEQGSLLAERFKLSNEGFTFFIFKNNKLLYWSNNTVLFEHHGSVAPREHSLLFMGNGWYEYSSRTNGPYLVVGLLLIKQEYAIQNKYLNNRFNIKLRLPESAVLQLKKEAVLWPVNNLKGDFLFGLDFLNVPSDSPYEIPLMIVFFSAIAMLLLFLYSFGKHMVIVEPRVAFLLIFLLILLRWIGLYYRLPTTFYNLPLFSPQFYASSWLLNSLGDFLISSLVFTYLVVFFHHYSGTRQLKEDSVQNKLWISYQVVFVFFFTFFFSVFVNYLLSGLILDSKISFNINNIFELSGYSLIGFAIIGLLLFSFYLICDGGIRFIQQTQFTVGQISILFLITQGLFLIVLLWLRDTELFHDYGVTSFLLANSLIIFISYIRSSDKRLFSFTRSLLVILGFSIYAAKTIADFNDIKEKENRKLLAVKLENEHDLVAEYLFEEVADKIAKDRFIYAGLLSSNQQAIHAAFNEEVLQKRILQLYLNGYWGKFELKVRCFDEWNNPVLSDNLEGKSLVEYKSILVSEGIPTYSKNFFYISNSAGRASYLGMIKSGIPSDSIPGGTIIIEMNARFLQDEGGFPDLLLSDRIPERRDFSNYSYAKYESGQLIKQFGKYPYFMQSKGYEKIHSINKFDRFIDFNGYSHLFYGHGPGSLIIISRQNQNLVVLITLFSYIFSFFCLLFVSVYIVYKLVRNSFRFEINFKTRIQFTVFAIVMATILLTGGGTIYYIIGNYASSQNQKVSERLSSLLVLIESELNRNPQFINTIPEEVSYNFSRLAANISVDFNIYSTDGKLEYSTQPKIFDQDIIATTMNIYAYNELHVKERTSYILYEQLGNLNFLSAYEPIRNLKNNVIGYINLPYFAKQNVLKKEISSLLVTLINIYVFLFSVAMFITFVISDRITRPLGLIQQRLSQIKLGKRTEPLEWTKKDEIGGLINEYNRMVDELHTSAELLAKSERESAWREMAKQVAHEIKNPLTPMKLSVQHLQRAWREQSPNIDDIMRRLSQTLIEQIETLSHIANEFSNFAKMPKASNAVLDLTVILENTVNLYAESDKIKINYIKSELINPYVFADKDQLIRAFSNLFKNAIQAIPGSREGLITVEITEELKNLKVRITDNGEGIAEDKLEKIFMPNFTTKTAGTGLGLAMVKNIMEQAGGKIWFETQSGLGTSFFILIPAYEEEVV